MTIVEKNSGNSNHNSRYLRFADLKRDYSLPKSTVYDLIKKQGFPRQIKLSPQTAVFNREEVDAWFKQREAMREGGGAMIIPIELPDHDSKDAVFFVLLLQGHTIYIDNLPELTGFQDAPQRAFRLRQAGFPIRGFKRAIKPKYTHPVAFYSVDKGEVSEIIGEQRLNAFIERVIKHRSFDATIKKGLQSKPQPLNAILSGQAMNSEVTCE